MGREEARAKLKRDRAYIAAENKKWPERLCHVPRDEWPQQRLDAECPMVALLRSRGFLCQVYAEPKHPEVLARLSIHRTALNDAGGWVDGITWDDLHRLKAEAGYAAYDAVEVYPAAGHLVCVANLRHLFVMREPLSFKWTNR